MIIKYIYYNSMTTEEGVVGKTIKIKCIVLPVMNHVSIKIRDDLSLRHFDKSFIEETNTYAKHIIYRGEILKNYTQIIRDLGIRNNDNFFIVKHNLSNTATQSGPSDILRRFISSGYGLNTGTSTLDNEEVTVDFTDSIVVNSRESNLRLLEDTINNLFTTTTALPPIPPPPLIPMNSDDVEFNNDNDNTTDLPIPEYEYQQQLEQLMTMGYVDEIEIRAALDITGGNIMESLIYLPS